MYTYIDDYTRNCVNFNFSAFSFATERRSTPETRLVFSFHFSLSLFSFSCFSNKCAMLVSFRPCFLTFSDFPQIFPSMDAGIRVTLN